jgi:hypothetical protein
VLSEGAGEGGEKSQAGAGGGTGFHSEGNWLPWSGAS